MRAHYRPRDKSYRQYPSNLGGRWTHVKWGNSSTPGRRASTMSGNTEPPSAARRSTGGLIPSRRSPRPSPRGGGPPRPLDPLTTEEVLRTPANQRNRIRFVEIRNIYKTGVDVTYVCAVNVSRLTLVL